MARKKMTDTQRLAKKLGVAESTIRARRARGQDLEAAPQIRLSESQQRAVGRARGTIAEVAEKYGVSESTVKRLRRIHRGATATGAKKTKKKK